MTRTLTPLSRLGLVMTAALLAATPALRAQDAPEPLVVVTTLPYLADLVRQVGGDHVEVQALVQPGQDPHFVQPTPALSVTLARAEVFLENGLQLELWTERVIDAARNARIRPGAPGHAYAATGVTPQQVPAQQTRASGDVHPGGNPHVWLDPLNLKVIARNVEQRLGAARPELAATFQRNREAFERRLDDACFGPELVKVLGASLLERLQRTGRLRTFLQERRLQDRPLAERAGGWLRRALDLGDLSMIAYHQDWTYFAQAFGVRVVATIEEKPGIPPSPGHLETLRRVAQTNHTRVVSYSPFYPASRAEGVAELVGGVAVQLPTQPGEAEGATDVFRLFDVIFARLEGASRRVAERGQ